MVPTGTWYLHQLKEFTGSGLVWGLDGSRFCAVWALGWTGWMFCCWMYSGCWCWRFFFLLLFVGCFLGLRYFPVLQLVWEDSQFDFLFCLLSLVSVGFSLWYQACFAGFWSFALVLGRIRVMIVGFADSDISIPLFSVS
ncbi:hypothetical protein KFK09_003497 [Dendrobium nobile]|uniref:Transmembrane protein n=1 Tax=Dendrobium nobile TaxID=94219 RepID=A0A8T3C0C3_DENNO|nr:hypothetical protein KFK09_003497 [Dendrobium nobile]